MLPLHLEVGPSMLLLNFPAPVAQRHILQSKARRATLCQSQSVGDDSFMYSAAIAGMIAGRHCQKHTRTTEHMRQQQWLLQWCLLTSTCFTSDRRSLPQLTHFSSGATLQMQQQQHTATTGQHGVAEAVTGGMPGC
jgi:hypothetical protein